MYIYICVCVCVCVCGCVFSHTLKENATLPLATLYLSKIFLFLRGLTQLHSEQTYFYIF